MESNVAIKVENLSKLYTLRETSIGIDGQSTNELWALKDLSFEIKKGESIGIIGPNGSGKSTLLKILAGITKPTAGKVSIRGKVASILDVGAGFHPELSGRENVFLNGQLLGFSKKEIQSCYDEIVEFSGIEKFIDEPVKNYSNGMFLRLSFSIMAHLDFDVYLFDEVLSVGDAAFVKKTNNKLMQLTQNKKTVLLASHNFLELEQISSILLIQNGKIGKSEILHNYSNDLLVKEGKLITDSNVEISQFNISNLHKEITVNKVKFYQNDNCNSDKFRTDRSFKLEVEFEIFDNKNSHDIILVISDYKGLPILNSCPFIFSNKLQTQKLGKQKITGKIPANFFHNKIYSLSIYFVKNGSVFLDELLVNSKNEVNFRAQISELKYTVRLEDIIYFKPLYFRENQSIKNGFENLKGQLLVDFDWQIGIENHD